jgi:hypothetical protein
MSFWKIVVALARGLLLAACLGSVAGASNYGPTDAAKDLQAIIAAEPAIGEALTDSLKKQGSMRSPRWNISMPT